MNNKKSSQTSSHRTYACFLIGSFLKINNAEYFFLPFANLEKSDNCAMKCTLWLMLSNQTLFYISYKFDESFISKLYETQITLFVCLLIYYLSMYLMRKINLKKYYK